MSHSPAPFIVGVSRSGTTLLRLMLDAHPRLAIPFETHFLNKLVRGRVDPTREQLFALITESASWPNLALDADALRRALEEIEDFSVAQGVRAFYRLCAGRFGKDRWGDKTPSYLSWMTGIERLLPEARFIHLIRDGRDTALSFRGLWFGPGDDLEEAARFWAEQIKSARSRSANLKHYMEVKYEDLLREPAGTLRRITDFLDLDFDPAMLEHHASATNRIAEVVRPFGPNGAEAMDIDRFKSIYANAQRPPDPEHVGRWRTEMSADEQRRFEAQAGRLLAELGYETRFQDAV